MKSKSLLLSASLVILMLSSCKKTDTDPAGANCDAMEVGLESTHVIIEQTGTWCSVCGGEKAEIQAAGDYHPRVHHMAVHGGDDPFANDRTQDFRSAVIRSSYFPTLMGSIQPSFMDYLLSAAPDAQVKLDVRKEGNILKIKAKVEILGDYEYARENGCGVFIDGQQVNVFDFKSLNIGLYLLEDGLDYPQAAVGAFTHNDVMRDYITARAQGDMLTDFGEAVSMGDSFCVYYEYDLSANTYHENIENCKILALIVEGNRCETTENEWFLSFLGSDMVEL